MPVTGRALGVDPSGRSAWAVWDDARHVVLASRQVDTRDELGLARLYCEVRDAAREWSACTAGVEGYYPAGMQVQWRSRLMQAERIGAAVAGLQMAQVPRVVRVAPATWRGYMGIRLKKGNARQNAEYLEWVYRAYGVKLGTTDEADAMMIARTALAVIQGVIEPGKGGGK